MRARILQPTPENVAIAAEALSRGEVVGMPTETVYGLAGGALLPEALARIFDTKERPTFDPLIVHVAPSLRGLAELERARLIDLSRLGPQARARAQALIERFWPGPLTLVLPKHGDVPELATSGLPAVALRMPAHPVAQALIEACGMPLAAPSANRFGRISPTSARAVAEELGDRIDWILDGGPCEVGVESTVIRIEPDGSLTQLRPGGLARSELEAAAECPIAVATSSSRPGASGSNPGPQAAPGMLESHYAPVKPMWLLPAAVGSLEPRHWREIATLAGGAGPLGLLIQQGDAAAAAAAFEAQLGSATGLPVRVVARSLSRSGELAEAARGLFATMRALDASEAQAIFAEPCPADRGLGHAISDRLGRACRGRL